MQQVAGGFALKRTIFFDTLNKVLLGISLVFILLGSVYAFAYAFAGVCVTLALIRTFSKDYQARQRENDIFKNYFARQRAKAAAKKATNVRRIRPVYEGKAGESTMHSKSEAPKSDSTHRIYKCPNCKKPLRVPRGKGKILITCQHCGQKFEKKT